MIVELVPAFWRGGFGVGQFREVVGGRVCDSEVQGVGFRTGYRLFIGTCWYLFIVGWELGGRVPWELGVV